MKRYTVAASALAVGADERWIDNAITQFDVPGVRRFRRGRDRHLTGASVLQLAIAHRLWVALGVPVGKALMLASSLGENGEAMVGEVRIAMDVQGMRSGLEQRLADATEHLVAPRRGRPPSRR